jgi:hypothetical protein
MEVRGIRASGMRLNLALRPSAHRFKDEEMVSIRAAFEKFVAALPEESEVLQMSISYLEPIEERIYDCP